MKNIENKRTKNAIKKICLLPVKMYKCDKDL